MLEQAFIAVFITLLQVRIVAVRIEMSGEWR